jgi:hypothetical protein
MIPEPAAGLANSVAVVRQAMIRLDQCGFDDVPEFGEGDVVIEDEDE